MKKKWDSKDPELQRRCLDAVVTRVDEIDNSSAGIIAAQDIIDIVTEHLAPEIYNKGLTDAKNLISTKLGDIELDIEALEQRR